MRIDTGFNEGDVISADFDPLSAKVIAWGPTRQVAIARLSRALEHTRIVVEGGTSNLAFLRALLVRDDVRAGNVDIGLVDALRVEPPVGEGVAMLAAAVDRFLSRGDLSDGSDRHRIEAGESFHVYRQGLEEFRVLGAQGALSLQYTPDGPYQSWIEVDERRHRIERAPEMQLCCGRRAPSGQ